MSSIAWQKHPAFPDVWCVYTAWGASIAAIAPQPGADGYWQGVVKPRSDGPYPGIRIDHCPSREEAMGVVGRELMCHWPEVVGAEPGQGMEVQS